MNSGVVVGLQALEQNSCNRDSFRDNMSRLMFHVDGNDLNATQFAPKCRVFECSAAKSKHPSKAPTISTPLAGSPFVRAGLFWCYR
jgi:hypothetical protein